MEARIKIVDLNTSEIKYLDQELLCSILGGEITEDTSFWYDVGYTIGIAYTAAKQEVESWFS